jgi:hypothetical protein
MKSHALICVSSSGEVGWSIANAQRLVAREHGFADWTAGLADDETKVDPLFERCVDAIVAGDLGLIVQLVH